MPKQKQFKNIYDSQGEIISRIRTVSNVPNLDPNFWITDASNRGISRVKDIENKPYINHPTTYSCAKVIAKNISRMPLMLVDSKDHTTPVEDRWGILNLFNKPNPLMTYTSFMQIMVLSYLLDLKNNGSSSGGQVFLTPKKMGGKSKEDQKIDLKSGQLPDFLFPYTDEVFCPHKIKSGDGLYFNAGWKFEVQGSPKTKLIYKPYELIRIYSPNPYDWLSGLAPSTPAKLALSMEVRADIYNTKLFDNNAIPAGLLSSEEWLDKTQRKQVLESYYEEYGGYENIGKVAVAPSGIKFQEIGKSHEDMQYSEQIDHAFNQFINVFGLNKIALGRYEDINYATLKEGRKMLWQDNYLPTAENIIEPINSSMINYITKGEALLKYDTREIEPLQPDYKVKAIAGGNMVERMKFPPALAAKLNGIPLSEEDIEQYPWLADHPDKIKLQAEKENNNTSPPEKDFDFSEIHKEYQDEEEKEKYKIFWKEYIKRIIDPLEKKYNSEMERFFHRQGNLMQDKVDEWLKEANKSILKASIPLDPSSFNINIPEETKKLMKMIKPVVKETLEYQEAELENELNGLVEWGVTDNRINMFTEARLQEMKEINTTTYKKAGEKIGEAIKQSTEDGLNPATTAKKVKEAIRDVRDTRKNAAKTIARTEIGIIANSCRFEVFNVEGYEYHKWVNSHDSKVRPDHVEVGGKVIKVGDTFPIVNLTHPGQSTGDPSQIINCRCVCVIAKKEEVN